MAPLLELLISLITVAAISPRVLLASPITFGVQPLDIKANAGLLAKDDYDLATFLGRHQQTTLTLRVQVLTPGPAPTGVGPTSAVQQPERDRDAQDALPVLP
jgi:hypothetical protein